jgi:hypothetical protein
MRQIARGLALLLAILVTACTGVSDTGGPPFGQAVATLPPIPPGETRIFFYRWNQPYDILSPTTVSLNGKPVGVSWVGRTFYRDVPPGTYEITVFSPGYYPNQFKTVTVKAGETVYVRIIPMQVWSQMICDGGEAGCQLDTFVVEVANPATAPQEMQGLPLIRG